MKKTFRETIQKGRILKEESKNQFENNEVTGSENKAG